MKMPSMDQLGLILDNDINVLMSGRHGVGKTAVVKELFTSKFGEIGKDWLYFSGSTLDPHINLMGIPRPMKLTEEYTVEETAADGTTTSRIETREVDSFDMLLPHYLATGKVKAIFIDEYNRSREGVRNAIMELVQFKSIHGKKFPGLKVVWAAINPPDENYDVQEADPAQMDRFLVQIQLDYELDREYFIREHGTSIVPTLDHWNTIPIEKRCSPRRYDQVIRAVKLGVPADFMLKPEMNIRQFMATFDTGSYEEKLKDLIKESDEAIAKWFTNTNNFERAKQFIVTNKTFIKKFTPFIHKEMLQDLCGNDPKRAAFVMQNSSDPGVIKAYMSFVTNSTCPESIREEILKCQKEWEKKGLYTAPVKP